MRRNASSYGDLSVAVVEGGLGGGAFVGVASALKGMWPPIVVVATAIEVVMEPVNQKKTDKL